MKLLRCGTPAIAVVALTTAASIAAAGTYARQSSATQLAARGLQPLELMISGPEAVPLPRRDWRQRFTAVLINRSEEAVVFVPPRNDWYGELRLEWQAVDSKGRWLDRQPNNAIECSPRGVMRMVPEVPAPLLTTEPPRQIRDADLVVLQPGERFELKNLADPWFSLNFRRHDVYTLSLHFGFASSHYELPKDSRYAKGLKKSSAIYVDSNELKLQIN